MAYTKADAIDILSFSLYVLVLHERRKSVMSCPDDVGWHVYAKAVHAISAGLDP